MNKIKVALIGTGRWGNILTPYIEKNFELITTTKEESLDNILLREDIEAVFIATPIPTHFKIAKKALEAGKHVFLEKPIAKTTAEAEELRDIANRKGLKLYVDYQMQSSPILNILKQVRLTNHVIGPLKYTTCHRCKIVENPQESCNWLLTSHVLSVIDLVSDVDKMSFKSVKDKDTNYFNDVIVGDMGNIIVNAMKEYKFEFVFFFEKGRVTYNHGYIDSVTIEMYNGLSHSPSGDGSEYLKNSVEKFKHILNGDAETNIDSAIRVTKVIENL